MEAESTLRTGLKLKNSLTGKLVDWDVSKEEFIPMKGRMVKWYTCGPTVYSQGHLGHARYTFHWGRNYTANDMIRRLLRDYFHYDVQVRSNLQQLVMNITDIDDKIIANSQREGVNFEQFAKKWEMDFFDDMK